MSIADCPYPSCTCRDMMVTTPPPNSPSSPILDDDDVNIEEGELEEVFYWPARMKIRWSKDKKFYKIEHCDVHLAGKHCLKPAFDLSSLFPYNLNDQDYETFFAQFPNFMRTQADVIFDFLDDYDGEWSSASLNDIPKMSYEDALKQAREMVSTIFTVNSTFHALNGNNGEATNTDDLDMVNFTPNFKLHGKYVGPGHTGAKKLGKINWKTKPIDGLDRAARNHDWQYTMQPGNRGAADALLSKRAWASIASQNGLYGKAKAAFVAAGMGAMSLVGSRNGQLLLDAPPERKITKQNKTSTKLVDFVQPLRRSESVANLAAFKADSAPKIIVSEKSSPQLAKAKKSQLNGNNGEATNTDDLNKGQKQGIMQSERKEAKKEAKKEVRKEIKKDFQKKAPIRSAKRSKPVEAGITATTFQNTATIKPYYKPMGINGRKTLFSLGTVNATGANSGSLFVNGGVNQSVAIDKNTFTGQAIGKDFDNYEQFRIKWAKYWFLPSLGSTTTGSCWIFSDVDAVDVLPQSSVVQIPLLTSHPGAKKHTLWKDVFSGPCRFNKSWLYTDSALVTDANTTAANTVFNTGDPRLTTAGVLNFINGDNISTSTVGLGEWFLELGVEFKSSQVSDLSSLVLSAKATAKSGFNIGNLSNGVPFDPYQFSINAVRQSNVGAYETIYNPRLVRPNIGGGSGTLQFRLPVGMYQFASYLSQTSGTGGSYINSVHAMTVNNAIYSLSMSSCIDTVNLGAPEYTNPVSGLDSVNIIMFGHSCRLRITAVNQGATALVTIQSNPNITSGPLLIGSVHTEVIRLPDFSAAPLGMWHPRGTALGNVGVSEDMRVTIWNGRKADDANYNVKSIVCPREFIEEARKALFKDWIEEKETTAIFSYSNFESGTFGPLPGTEASSAVAPSVEELDEAESYEDDEKETNFQTISLSNGVNNPPCIIIYGYCKANDDHFSEVATLKKKYKLNWESSVFTAKQDFKVDYQPQPWPLSDLEQSQKQVSEPESPEIIENPLTKSVHLNASVAQTLLSLVSKK